MDQNTTRRAALTTGTLTALGVGLMSAAGARPEPVAAQTTPASDLIAALVAEEKPDAERRFQEFLAEWKAKREQLHDRLEEIQGRVAAFVPDELYRELMLPFSDLAGEYYGMESSLERELVLRHVPGLEPVLRLLWHHAVDSHIGPEGCGGGYCSDRLDRV